MGIHAVLKNYLQASTKKPLSLAHEDFLLSLEYFFLAALLYCIAELIGCLEKQQAIDSVVLKPFCTSPHKMERGGFAMGSPRRETKQEKRQRLRKERDRKCKEKMRKERRTRVFTPLQKKTDWCILPSSQTEGFDFWIRTLQGDTFLTKRKHLLESVTQVTAPRIPVPGWNSTFGDSLRKEYREKAQRVLSLLYLNQTLRWKFKIFLTKVRTKRFQKINETDPITLEAFKQPVTVYSFEQQKIYRFEAEAIAKHIHKRLLHNDGHMPTPISPRNPLTNEEFTLSQTMGLLEQCKRMGHTTWALEAFHACRFDLLSFSTVHSKPLRLHALHTTMSMPTYWECIDTLYDFIKSQHLEHNAVFPVNVYKWAVNHAMDAERIEKWRKLCIKWYEIDILVEDDFVKEGFFQELQKKTKVLCDSPKELIELRLAYIKSRALAENGCSGSRHTERTG